MISSSIHLARPKPLQTSPVGVQQPLIRSRVSVRGPLQVPNVVQIAPLCVGTSRFQPCSLADLQPGDIAFQYQTGRRNFRQGWIGVGTNLANIWNPCYQTDASVMHSFVVVAANPQAQILHTVDAAGGNLEDISECCMNFQTGERVVPGAQYFFYRAVDPRTRQRIVRIARNWAAPGLHNFSIKHAAVSWARPFTLRKRSRKRALYFMRQAQTQAPLRRPNSSGFYRMMCSEFVVNVCTAAMLLAWRDAHRELQSDCDILRGLYEGEMGDAFAVEAKGITPSLLQRRLQDCPGVQTVGYFNEGH